MDEPPPDGPPPPGTTVSSDPGLYDTALPPSAMITFCGFSSIVTPPEAITAFSMLLPPVMSAPAYVIKSSITVPSFAVITAPASVFPTTNLSTVPDSTVTIAPGDSITISSKSPLSTITLPLRVPDIMVLPFTVTPISLIVS